jgi:cytochrome P450
MTALGDFVPPYPKRLTKMPSPWERVRLGRKNLLAVFEEEAFSYEFRSMKLLGRDIFLCNTPKSVQFFFSTHNDSFERKSPGQRKSLEPVAGDGLILSDGNTWRRRRRIVAPIVHISRMSEFVPVMVDAVRETCERWARLELPAEIDMLSEMAQLTAEIICRTVFGRGLGRDRALQVVKGFTEYQHRIGQFDLLTLLGVPEWLPRPHPPGVYRSVRRIHNVLDELIAEHRAHRDGNEDSIVRHLLDARDEETGERLDARALRNEAAVLLLAGHETTASSLAWTWYILSQTPEVEERLHAEIDQVLGGRLPTHADVPKLIYTRAVFEEVLRLYPPIPLLTREAVHDEIFHDCPISKGSLIVVCPWLLHRNPVLWHNPDHFIPTRFMPGGYRPPSKFAYIPFSVGPRTCTGMAFGMTEAILCVAIIAQSFIMRLKPGHRVEVACRLTTRPGNKLPMQLYSTTRWYQKLIEDSGLFDRAFYLAQCPELAASGVDPIHHYLQYGAAEGRNPNPLFNTDWYRRQYPDVQATGTNPLLHYLVHGSAEGRDPSPLFDTSWYLARYPEVRESGANPLAHYLQRGAAETLLADSGLFDRNFYLTQCPELANSGADPVSHYLLRGATEGRDPNPLFDSDWYLRKYPDVQAIGKNPLLHYLVHGSAEGRDPSPLFDTDWYLAQYPEVRESGKNPLAHYLQQGATEGNDPNSLFDSDWYLRTYPDVQATGQNPLVDYIMHGVAEGRDPSPLFDTKWYLEQYPDVRACEINPLVHYLHYGATEGRRPRPPDEAGAGLEKQQSVAGRALQGDKA